MDHQPRLERLLIGLRGLGLLRAWPLGDRGRGRDPAGGDRRDVGAPRRSADERGARAPRVRSRRRTTPHWSETYDEPGNALLDVEERALRRASLRPCRLATPRTSHAAPVALERDALRRSVIEWSGIDPSEAMLDRARARGHARRVPSWVPSTRLPLADDSVDLATCGLALTHSTDLSGHRPRNSGAWYGLGATSSRPISIRSQSRRVARRRCFGGPTVRAASRSTTSTGQRLRPGVRRSRVRDRAVRGAAGR